MDLDDEDPVVQEIPVFLAATLAQQLVLVQHPATKHPQPLADASALRVKVKALRFEVDVPIDKTSKNYSEDAAERLGRGLDNAEIRTAYDKQPQQNSSSGSSAMPRLLDKITLQSSLVPESPGSRYLIGALRDDEFHLTPVCATVQLRPALKYLDKILEKEKAAAAKILQHEQSLENQASGKKDEEPVERGITMAVRSIEDNPEAIRKARDLEEERQFALEKWVDFSLLDESVPESEDAFEKLFSLGDEMSYAFSKQDYLQCIGPKLSSIVKLEYESGKKNNQPVWCMDDVGHLPLPQLLRAIMLHAHVIQFSTLQTLTNYRFTAEEMIPELTKIAVLLRGVWVVRSELLYSGRIAEARRLLLMQLLRNRLTSRWEVNKLARLPHPIITNLFVEICSRVGANGIRGHVGSGLYAPGPGYEETFNEESSSFGEVGDEGVLKWGLKIDGDVEFCDMWPDLVEEQKKLVDEEGESARHFLETRGSVKTPQASAKFAASRNSAIVQEKNSAPASVPSSSTPASVAPKGGPSTSTSSSTTSKKSKTDSKKGSIENFVIKGSTPTDQCQNLIISIFSKYGIASQPYIVSTILRHKDVNPPVGVENLLDSEDINEEFVGNMVTQLCVVIQKDRLALATLGSSIDEYRDAIVSLFKTKTSAKKTEITQACMAATGKAIPQGVYTKIMKELAVSSGPSWELKQSPTE
ncbi:DNA-directed RNA polymerase III subunit RPC5 [Entophlyctis sp. JEL0112]|nr:DNA-directed RNA polymerase III subunit RPC5 [Entophlyctis sp. JEL0112]